MPLEAKFSVMDFDYGKQTAIAVTLPDGRRHVVRFNKEDLLESGFTREQMIESAKDVLTEWVRLQCH